MMALACTTTPTPIPDVPLFDKKTVEGLVTTQLLVALDNNRDMLQTCVAPLLINSGEIEPEYIGNDIWVIKIGPFCTIAFHDKDGHVILTQQDKTTD